MTSKSQPPDPILAMLPEVRGRRILQPCVLYARLGRGGMGAVYLAKHLTLMQKQVVKCLWLMGQGATTDSGFIERFQQEARIAAEMTHQNLVRVTHVDRLGDLHYLVMEYVEGEDIDRRVQRLGVFDEPAALATVLGAAQGLGYAHTRGIVHRDVKPANLMISQHGEVKVIDLGLARAIDSTRQLGATVGTLGTPLYMAPEQWLDASVGPTADVWALGAVLHFALTGRSPLPKSATTHQAIRDCVAAPDFADQVAYQLSASAEVKRVLARCLATDPAARYLDARELANDLRGLVSGDERLLVDQSGAPIVNGNEPSDDELRKLQDLLELRGGANSDDHTIADMPTPAALPSVRMPTPTGDTRQPPASPTPAPTARTLLRASSAQAGHVPNARRNSWPGRIAAMVALLAIATAGVVAWPRVDYEGLQREAMAAIYQERYEDADRLLTQLEDSPAFADQARRLRIDALVKFAKRTGKQEPARALLQLARADEIAKQLLIARDTDDALQRIANERQPLATRLLETMAGALTVQAPLPGAVITRGEQIVRAQLDRGSLPLRATIQGRALEQQDGAWHGTWQAPAGDGDAELQIVIEHAPTRLRHTVAIPVLVKRGAVALHVEEPAGVANQKQPRLRAAVDNGPLEIICVTTAPDGTKSERALGEHDGAFEFDVACDRGDGRYLIQLTAESAGASIQSPECAIVIDCTTPALQLDRAAHATRGKTTLVEGDASEACEVFVVGARAFATRTDEQGHFALPLTLPDEEGQTVFTFGVRDAAGNQDLAAASFTVNVDRTAPQLVIAELRYDRAVGGAEVSVTGRASEPGTIAIDDEAPIETATDGTFELTATMPIGELEQPVRLRLTAKDAAGNIARPHHVDVLVDRRAPRILPGGPDGEWWADGFWVLRIEDVSSPCELTIDGEDVALDDAGLGRFVRRADAGSIVVRARDRLGNEQQRTLSDAGVGAAADSRPAPGPSWGQPAPGSAIDEKFHLHERVTLTIGDQQLVMRLVRPLRGAELPPRTGRDRRAAPLLPNQGPFYLSATEVSVAAWRAYVEQTQLATPKRTGFQFDPKSCQWRSTTAATWQQPLHPDLLQLADAAQRDRWPVTQVTPKEARAFCKQFGLRLPSRQEWLFVTRLGSRERYGWKPNGPLEGRANYASLELRAAASALKAYDTVHDGFATLAPIDAFPAAAQLHPWGFHNLLGNAAEWCTTTNGRVAACGGNWLSPPAELRVNGMQRAREITTGAWDCVGFRVARDL